MSERTGVSAKAEGPGGPDHRPWVVVGLGNPGPQYAGNRHNVGAMVLAEVADRLGARWSVHRSRAQLVQLRLPPRGGVPGPQLVLARPTSYMNESGGQTQAVLKFFGADPDRLLVVHDELDIPFADLRLKFGGGEGGHNGLRSISRCLGTKDYARLRVGVGRPPGRMDAADFVLRDFSAAERKELPLLLAEAADAVLDVAGQGWERTQAAVNTASGQRP